MHPDYLKKIAELAAQTGYPDETIIWVHAGLVIVGKHRRLTEGSGDMSAAELCRALIADLLDYNPVQLRAALASAGIESSRDLGRITYALVDAGMCSATEHDSLKDFDSIFERAGIENYLTRVGLTRPGGGVEAIKKATTWIFYALGTGLLLYATEFANSRDLLMLGSAALGIGFMISKIPQKKPRRFGLPGPRPKPSTAGG